MRYRELRIAWLVFFGAATALLIVLWERGFSVHEGFYRVNVANNRTAFGWTAGSLGFNYKKIAATEPPQKWTYFSEPVVKPHAAFRTSFSKGDISFRLPLWFLALLTSIAAAIP